MACFLLSSRFTTSSSMASRIIKVVSRCRVYPQVKSSMGDFKLSICDIPLLTIHYNQKGALFSSPPFPPSELLTRLKTALSQALTHFPPLAGQLVADSEGVISVTCNDFGVDFIQADGSSFHVADLLRSAGGDVPKWVKECFPMNGVVCYDGLFRPLLAVQVTDLADGVFIACTMNHTLADGTSFWNFFNSFAEICRGANRISGVPDFSRHSILVSPVFPKLPPGGPPPVITFSEKYRVREKIFKFSNESILKLKGLVNETIYPPENVARKPPAIISSFQSLCALLWRGITRARRLPSNEKTTFYLTVNYRHRIKPNLDPLYFGNVILSIPITSTAAEILNGDIHGCAVLIHEAVQRQGHAKMQKHAADWERRPEVYSPGNIAGAIVLMGSSPRFPMYASDFGWGKPITIRCGPANKYDGKIAAFPGGDGDNSVDFEVALAPETMAGLESDPEFMLYVSPF